MGQKTTGVFSFLDPGGCVPHKGGRLLVDKTGGNEGILGKFFTVSSVQKNRWFYGHGVEVSM